MTDTFSIHPLHQGLVVAKPIQEAPETTILELESAGHLRIQRKHRGHSCLATSASRLYSKSVRELTANFPDVAEELRAIGLPHDTLVNGEILVAIDGVEIDSDFGALANSRPERAIRTQQERGLFVELRLFNVIAHKGRPVLHLPRDDRYDLLQELLAKHESRRIRPVHNLSSPLAIARTESIASQWEGLVLYDGRASSAFHLHGKAKPVPRPAGCWKWKNYNEDDFVATGWVPSDKPSRVGMLRDITIAQYHPKTGELVDCGRTSAGLTLAQRRELADDSKYPFVVEIEFECRTRTGKLIEAEIKRIRDDKSPEECLFPSS